MPLLLQITEDSFSQSQSNCYMSFYIEPLESKMRNLIFVKYDITQTDLLFSQSLQSICSVNVDKPTVILLVTVFSIIKRPSHFILHEIPHLFSNLKCSNVQLCNRR